MLVSREQRLASVTASILRVWWYVVFIGAFLFVDAAHGARVADHSGRITSFFLGIMIFLISMNRPLKGAVSVRPDSFPSGCGVVMRWEEPA